MTHLKGNVLCSIIWKNDMTQNMLRNSYCTTTNVLRKYRKRPKLVVQNLVKLHVAPKWFTERFYNKRRKSYGTWRNLSRHGLLDYWSATNETSINMFMLFTVKEWMPTKLNVGNAPRSHIRIITRTNCRQSNYYTQLWRLMDHLLQLNWWNMIAFIRWQYRLTVSILLWC